VHSTAAGHHYRLWPALSSGSSVSAPAPTRYDGKTPKGQDPWALNPYFEFWRSTGDGARRRTLHCFSHASTTHNTVQERIVERQWPSWPSAGRVENQWTIPTHPCSSGHTKKPSQAHPCQAHENAAPDVPLFLICTTELSQAFS
jgi:hypothetical protein